MRQALATEVAQRASGGYCLLAGMTAAAASGRRRRDQIAYHLPQRHKLRRESSKTANAEHAAEIVPSAPNPRRGPCGLAFLSVRTRGFIRGDEPRARLLLLNE